MAFSSLCDDNNHQRLYLNRLPSATLTSIRAILQEVAVTNLRDLAKDMQDMLAFQKSSPSKLGELSPKAQRLYAHECRIRNAFARDFKEQRPLERVLSCETRYAATALRADLRSVDRTGLLREWEFKIQALIIMSLVRSLHTSLSHARRCDSGRCAG